MEQRKNLGRYSSGKTELGREASLQDDVQRWDAYGRQIIMSSVWGSKFEQDIVTNVKQALCTHAEVYSIIW
jgi:hypothetical protein